MKIMSIDEVAELVNKEDRSFIGCVLKKEDRFGFVSMGNGEFCSDDWIEGEGANELIIDSNGIMLRFEGYYFEVL